MIDQASASPKTLASRRKQALRHDIMIVVKANRLPVTGDFWLMLVFRTECELKTIARDLCIQVA